MFDSGALSVAVATVAASMIAYVLLFIRRNVAEEGRKRYPPSVPVLPLLVAVLRGGMGVMPDYFRRCAEKLGPVLSCNLGGRLIVILNDKEALTEAYVKQSEIFSDRFEFWTETNVANYDLKGIVFSKYTQMLKKNRKISLIILKEFGYGVSNVSETRILHEVESLVDEIMKSNGSPMDPKYMTDRAISNVVFSILFGRQFMSVEKNHKRLIDGVHEFCDNVEPALNMAPLLRFLPSFKKKIEVVFRSNRDLMRVIGEGIECNKADATEPTFVRRYLEIEGPDYDHQELLYILRDLVLAATETVSSVVCWAFVELANHPDIQSRLQREIDDAVHENMFPSLKDKPRLPYTEAVILELLRRRTVVPFPIPRVSCKDTQVLGCFVPKGSLIITNTYSQHMSELTWKDPEKFDPERFFDKDNNCTGGERVQPFGYGKRSCLGEILAQQEMFLFLTSLVQRFDIRPPEGQDSISVTEISAVTMHPSDFKVRLIPRRRS